MSGGDVAQELCAFLFNFKTLNQILIAPRLLFPKLQKPSVLPAVGELSPDFLQTRIAHVLDREDINVWVC